MTAHTSTPTGSSPASDAGAARSARVHTTDISLSFCVSERLQRNSPACFNRFWITMPDMNCLQAWSRAYDDHIKASRRKRKSEHCQLPYELSLSNSHLSLQHSPALTSLPETSDKRISASLRAHIKEINKPSAPLSSTSFSVYRFSVSEASTSSARAASRVMLMWRTNATCCCWNAAERIQGWNATTLSSHNTGIKGSREILSVNHVVSASGRTFHTMIMWPIRAEPITGKGTESICRSVPAAMVWVWN